MSFGMLFAVMSRARKTWEERTDFMKRAIKPSQITSQIIKRALGVLAAAMVLGGGLQVAQAEPKPPVSQQAAFRGNYSNRRGNPTISYIVIHTIEGSASGCVSWFRNPASKVSAHYVIKRDGGIIQCVDESKKAWHAGQYNNRSIGIEHEGYADRNTWTDAQVRASARLSRYLCAKYNIPKTRRNIVGHIEVPGSTHHDPGRFFDWDYYMKLIRGESTPSIRAERPAHGQIIGMSDLQSETRAQRKGLRVRWALGQGKVSGHRVLVKDRSGKTIYDSGHVTGQATEHTVPLRFDHDGRYLWKVRIVGPSGGVKETDWQGFATDFTPPTLKVIAPREGSVVDATPGLRWSYQDSESKQVSYRIYLDDDENHDVIIGDTKELNGSQSIYYLKSSLKPGKKYWWRVMAYDGRGNVVLTPWTSFTMSEDAVDLAAKGTGVTLVSPSAGQTVAAGQKPALRWRFYSAENRPQKGVRVLIDDDADHSSLFYETSHMPGMGSRYNATQKFEEGKVYFWKVRVWDGKESHESDWGVFVYGKSLGTKVRDALASLTKKSDGKKDAKTAAAVTKRSSDKPNVGSKGARGALDGLGLGE